MSCDDWCQLALDSENPYVPGQNKTPSPVVITNRGIATSWRNYIQVNEQNGKYISDWI